MNIVESTKLRDEAWRQELRRSMSNKERMQLERVVMPEEPAQVRNKSMDLEVNRGLSAEAAQAEARRCLDCPTPTCMDGCPVSIEIPDFIKEIERGEFAQAAKVLRRTSSLPAVCGRVCPQEKQCESQCIYTAKLKKPAVAIGYLERFASDWELANGELPLPELAPANGKRIAVIGSGPAGLSFAGDMAKLGYRVNVFEALHEIGGVLKYGIPEFRLPNEVVNAEIKLLERMGVVFESNVIIGRTLSYDDLLEEGFEGIFVGSGAGLPKFMHIPGENLAGVMSSNEYLTRVNLMHAGSPGSETPVFKGRSVAVIGGGNTAMDSVRTALRLGAERAMIVYRRSEEEMPARLEEVKHAKEEGVEFLTLHNPVEYFADEKGRVCGMRLQVMELGEPDESGRRRPQEVIGETKDIAVDEVIVSIGVEPNPLIPRSIEGLVISKWGTIEVDDDNKTALEIVYAGGDIVRGGATVILAMGDGRKAAKAMHERLSAK